MDKLKRLTIYVDVTPNHLPPNGWEILNKVLKLIIFVTQRLTKNAILKSK